MGLFSFEEWKNQVVNSENHEFEKKLTEFVEYLMNEKNKGKIPLIIAGAGTSSDNVTVKTKESGEKIYINSGLPCLSKMILRLRDNVLNIENTSGERVQELKDLFYIVDDNLENVDREWMSKVFSFLEKSNDPKIKRIWREYCEWFFFECIDYKQDSKEKKCGALTTWTSKTATEIAKMYDNFSALCLSANFDNYIDFSIMDTHAHNGIPIYDRELAERYFKRNRRDTVPFETPPYNKCVLHANGDVFWLYCSGEKGEGYCPDTGKKIPAFSKPNLFQKEDMTCQFCKSKLDVTMTMPGTYEKDYNTRAILTAIWKYVSTKISAVITVGLSCNWDEVLLKFILQLISEMDIPLLDINDLSDKAKEGKSRIVEKIVKESHLEACAYITKALDGTRKINELASCIVSSDLEVHLKDEYKIELKNSLSEITEIKRLKQVSQLGLKSYWLESSEENERWSHSIQVADIAVEMYEKLCGNSKKKELSFEKVLLYAAGLLHDCGHLPFSHLLEDVFEELSWHLAGEVKTFRHGQYTKRVIEKIYNDEKCNFKNILQQYGIKAEEVINCINGKYGISFIDALINSAIDADKIAYIFKDAQNTKKNLALDQHEFLKKLLAKSYITQEGLVALDGESAWYAMRLLDERKRMYDELYYDNRIRFLEAAVKYIITTYFVQKYNDKSLWNIDEKNKYVEDLGDNHISAAINDLYQMIEKDSEYECENLSDSISPDVKNGIKKCMEIILNAKQSNGSEPNEIKILKCMYKQLTGEDVFDIVPTEEIQEYLPCQDSILDNLVKNLNYNNLSAVRKKIILNYPGTILIDIYMPVKYFSTPTSREPNLRIDGTRCGQEMILVPDGDRKNWNTQQCLADIGLLDYTKEIDNSRDKIVFNVYKIGNDSVSCEHAINMLKKELEEVKGEY